MEGVGTIFDSRDRKRLLFKRGKGGKGWRKKKKKKKEERCRSTHEEISRTRWMKSLKMTVFATKGWSFQKIPLWARRAAKISNSLWPVIASSEAKFKFLTLFLFEIFFQFSTLRNNDTASRSPSIGSASRSLRIGNSSYVDYVSKLGGGGPSGRRFNRASFTRANGTEGRVRRQLTEELKGISTRLHRFGGGRGTLSAICINHCAHVESCIPSRRRGLRATPLVLEEPG